MEAAELELVYRDEARRIKAALARSLGDLALAEDAVQDAFVEAIEHWHGEPPANRGGWLATRISCFLLAFCSYTPSVRVRSSACITWLKVILTNPSRRR